MRENELAGLLMQIGADRGVDLESAADELASVPLPSFVDARAFRTAVVQALEAHLRAQMEQRLQQIRRRFDVDQPQAVIVPPVPQYSQPTPEPFREPSVPIGLANNSPEPADQTMTDLAPLDPAAVEVPLDMNDEELPSDATMVWTTRHG